MSNNYKKQCPDGAVCNHDCESRCFRVDNCGPLPGKYPDDEWPSEMTLGVGETRPVSINTKICVVCELPIEDGHMRGMGDGSGDRFAHEACYWRAQAEKREAAYYDVKTIGCHVTELQDRTAMQDNIEHLKAKLEEVVINKSDRRTEARGALEASVRMALEKNLELRQVRVVELEKERDAFRRENIGLYNQETKLKVQIEQLEIVRNQYWEDRTRLKRENESMQGMIDDREDRLKKARKVEEVARKQFKKLRIENEQLLAGRQVVSEVITDLEASGGLLFTVKGGLSDDQLRSGEDTCSPDDAWAEDAKWLLELVKEMADILKVLDKESLGDFIYNIRSHECGSGEWEGDSWKGPRVTAWSDACSRLKAALARLEEPSRLSSSDDPLSPG